MQTGKNVINDKKFANLVAENYGRKYYRHISNESNFMAEIRAQLL